jgi:mannan endo-1,4-beta-mannosidase
MLKRIISLILTGVLLVLTFGCNGNTAQPSPSVPEGPPEESPPSVIVRERLPRPERDFSHLSAPGLSGAEPVTYLAEDANLYGSLEIMDDGAVGRFTQQNPEDMLEFVVEVENEGFYRLEFLMRTMSDYKENYLIVNGAAAGALAANSEDYEPVEVQRVFLQTGANTVGITSHWGWIAVMSLTVSGETALDPSFFEVPIKLVNPNADDNALGLMSFLAMQYGLYILSGQQSQGDWRQNHGLFGGEAGFIYEQTGKRPAVIGLDFIDYTPSRVALGARSTETEAAILAWNNNAIVTFCWHWNAPTPYIDGTWYRAFYTNHSQRGFFKRIMDGEDPEGYQMLLDDIDVIAVQLTRLRDAGVPILWRPLHEASGGWFWWGTDRESYLKLWKLMFDRLTNHHDLTNLIWVWNGQHKDWYPGDEYVDIIGEDIYAAAHDHSSQSGKFFEAAAYTDAPKMLAMTENGALFDPELAMRDGAMWAWWCVWNGNFVRTEEHTTFDTLRMFYNNGLVLTLEDLPDLKTYPIYID